MEEMVARAASMAIWMAWSSNGLEAMLAGPRFLSTARRRRRWRNRMILRFQKRHQRRDLAKTYHSSFASGGSARQKYGGMVADQASRDWFIASASCRAIPEADRRALEMWLDWRWKSLWVFRPE